jgi:hypothetical protein
MAPGDVLLIEIATDVPLEGTSSDFDAIKLATDAGRIVVEAAANFGLNLDDPIYNNRFNRNTRDSRAILVGAGCLSNDRASFSNYGSRVDVHAHGCSVTTTGFYGNLWGSSMNDYYTGSFNGTSSAAAIVAAAAAVVQGYLRYRGRPLLTPNQLSNLFKTTGSPQTGNTAEWIGPKPNLKAALATFGADAPPTNLAASNITATAATVSWTNGDASAGTTTFVQYRLTGTSPWITANGGVGLPAGTSSYRLTGLHCSTSYDVNVFHRKNGVDSPWLTLTLFTTAACTVSSTINPPTNFRETDCRPSSAGGKSYGTWITAWTAGANPASSIFHIVESFSNSPGFAIIRRGPITTTAANLGPYLVQSASSPRYFWVRHVNGAQASVWVALIGNPIRISSGC